VLGSNKMQQQSLLDMWKAQKCCKKQASGRGQPKTMVMQCIAFLVMCIQACLPIWGSGRIDNGTRPFVFPYRRAVFEAALDTILDSDEVEKTSTTSSVEYAFQSVAVLHRALGEPETKEQFASPLPPPTPVPPPQPL